MEYIDAGYIYIYMYVCGIYCVTIYTILYWCICVGICMCIYIYACTCVYKCI